MRRVCGALESLVGRAHRERPHPRLEAVRHGQHGLERRQQGLRRRASMPRARRTRCVTRRSAATQPNAPGRSTVRTRATAAGSARAPCTPACALCRVARRPQRGTRSEPEVSELLRDARAVVRFVPRREQHIAGSDRGGSRRARVRGASSRLTRTARRSPQCSVPATSSSVPPRTSSMIRYGDPSAMRPSLAAATRAVTSP